MGVNQRGFFRTIWEDDKPILTIMAILFIIAMTGLYVVYYFSDEKLCADHNFHYTTDRLSSSHDGNVFFVEKGYVGCCNDTFTEGILSTVECQAIKK